MVGLGQRVILEDARRTRACARRSSCELRSCTLRHRLRLEAFGTRKTGTCRPCCIGRTVEVELRNPSQGGVCKLQESLHAPRNNNKNGVSEVIVSDYSVPTSGRLCLVPFQGVEDLARDEQGKTRVQMIGHSDMHPHSTRGTSEL